MKAQFKGRVYNSRRGESETTLTLGEIKGKVDTRLVTAQEASVSATIIVKNIVADQMKIGSAISITISDEEENEGLT